MYFHCYVYVFLLSCIFYSVYSVFVLFVFVLFYILFVFLLFYVLFVFVLFSELFVCKCVLYYCHRFTTQLQLTNISYLIISHCMYLTKCVFENQKFVNQKDVLQRGILLSIRVFRKFTVS